MTDTPTPEVPPEVAPEETITETPEVVTLVQPVPVSVEGELQWFTGTEVVGTGDTPPVTP